MSEQSPKRKHEAAKTREELLDRLARSQETGKAMPIVRDPDLLRAGDLLHVVEAFEGVVKHFFVLGIAKRPDQHGQERMYISGLEEGTRDYRDFVNNPDKIEEYAALTGRQPKDIKGMTELMGAMATEPIVDTNSSLSITEYTAQELNILPDNNGQYHIGIRGAYLARAAAESQPVHAT
ncbi:MAG: hypothetical protein WA843_04680 [Candidatus Saccharimonadales bacterium]